MTVRAGGHPIATGGDNKIVSSWVNIKTGFSFSLQCHHCNTRITIFVEQVNFCAAFLCLDIRLLNSVNL